MTPNKAPEAPQEPSATSDDVRDRSHEWKEDLREMTKGMYAWKQRAEKAEARVAELEQQNRAILYDYHNGTPCEQIAWAQEREELKSSLSLALAQRDVAEDKLSWEKAVLDQTKDALADARDKALEEAARAVMEAATDGRNVAPHVHAIRALRTNSEK